MTLLPRVAPEAAIHFKAMIASRSVSHQLAVARLATAELPLVACAWDFKASNLVFTADHGPVLADPDHGGRVPRLYDLACWALLFHCDCATAPGGLFYESQWMKFLAGYREAVTISMVEHCHWSDVLMTAWMDQGLWLLANWPEGWEDPREQSYLSDLAAISPTTFVAGRARQERNTNLVSHYLDERGRLTFYLTRRRARLAVLSHLSRKFIVGMAYTKANVNETLRQFHTFRDWALLRGELVDRGFLIRDPAGAQYFRVAVEDTLPSALGGSEERPDAVSHRY